MMFFHNNSAAILAGSKHTISIFVSSRLGMFSFSLSSSFFFFLFLKSVTETTSFLLRVHVNCFNRSKRFRDLMKYTSGEINSFR